MKVPSAMVEQVKIVAKSMQLHAEHDSLSGRPHYQARLATLGAKESLKAEDYKHAQSVHKAAGYAKHLVGAKAVAASSGLSCRSSGCWADVDDEEVSTDAAAGSVKFEDELVGATTADGCIKADGFSLLSFGGVAAGDQCASPGIGACTSQVSPTFADQVLSSSLSPFAQEFVPSCVWSDGSVPSIGAQLDFLLMSLCSQLPVSQPPSGDEQSYSKVVQKAKGVEVSLPSCGAVPAVQLQNAELKEENDRLKKQLDFLQAELAAVATNLDKKYKDLEVQVCSQVVEAVVGRLPHILQPIVEQGLVSCKGAIQSTFESSIGSMRQDFIQEALRLFRAEPGKLTPAPRKEVDVPVCLPDMNVDVPVEVDLEEGMLVGIQGLKSMPALNGTVGCVLGFDLASKRFKVQVEDGTVKKIKRCNLVLEDELGDVSDMSDGEQFVSDESRCNLVSANEAVDDDMSYIADE